MIEKIKKYLFPLAVGVALSVGLGYVKSAKSAASAVPAVSVGQMCYCAQGMYCVGPRGGRYCVTDRGKKQYLPR